MSLGRLDHYEVLRFVGGGGQSDVYLAHDTHLDCDVALKVVRGDHAGDPTYRSRLLAEARVLARLDHPNIVDIIGCGEAVPDPPGFLRRNGEATEAGSVVYLAMRYVEGTDLAAEIAARPLPVATVIEWAKQIARGLDAAHTHGVVHRDLKPGNVRITTGRELKLVDFGLAAARRDLVSSLDPTASVTSEYLLGTIGYLCPEQCEHGSRPDPRCDLFSFGVILYEMLTGRRPFGGETVIEVLHEIANTEPPPLERFVRDLPPGLQHIVDKLLRKDRKRRYQSAREVLTDLEDLPLRKATHVSPDSRSRPARGRLARRAGRVAWALAVVAAAALLTEPALRWLRRTETVVVPAFTNLTGDPALDRMVGGLGADLLTSLTQCPINVVGSTLRDESGAPERDPAVLGRMFGAQSVLLGTLHAVGGTGPSAGLSLHVRLVRVRTGTDAWGAGWDAAADRLALLREHMLSEVPAHWRRRGGTAAASAGDEPARPAAAVERYLRGLGYLESSDPAARDSALAEFDAALAWDPGFSRALAGRARALLAAHLVHTDTTRLARAEHDARQAVRLAPEELDGYRALGRVLRERGRAAEAVAALHQIVERNERDAEALSLLGASYRQLGDMERANFYLKEALDVQPEAPKLWRTYGIFLLASRADFAGAERAFRREIALRPEDNRGYEDLAAALTEQCRYAEAVATYARRPNPGAGSLDLHGNRGTAYFFAGNYHLAMNDYLEAVAQRPDDGNWRLNLGDCYAHLGRLPEALQQYREARVLLERETLAAPDDLAKRSAYAMGLAKAGETARARVEIDRCWQANPVGDAAVMHNLAKAHAVCGDSERAIKAVEVLVSAHDFSKCRLRAEDEFEPLHADARFRRLVGLKAG